MHLHLKELRIVGKVRRVVSVEDTTYSENLSDTDIIDNTIEVDFLNYTP